MLTAAAIAVLLFITWLSTDKVVYQGEAHAMPNDMRHYSQRTRTVFIVLGEKLPGHEILIGEVSLEQAQEIAEDQPAATVDVTVKKRAFQKPRVTNID